VTLQQISAGRPYFKYSGEKMFLLSRRVLKFANSSNEIDTNKAIKTTFTNDTITAQ